MIRFLKIKIKFSYNNMSLYDRYHSETNINYMYNLVNEIINKNTNDTISDNEEFKKIFKKNSLQIFNETNTEDIEDLNKILLEQHVELFTGMLNVNKAPQIQQINDNNFDTRYNELMQNRNLPLNVQISEKNDKNTPLRNTNNELDNPEFFNNQSFETQISDILPEKMNTEIKQEENEKKKVS